MNRKNFLAALAVIPFLSNPLKAMGQVASPKMRSSQTARQIAHRFAAYNHLGLRFMVGREAAVFTLTHPTPAGESVSRFMSTFSFSSKKRELNRQFSYCLGVMLRNIEREHGLRGTPPNPVGVFRWTWERV